MKALPATFQETMTHPRPGAAIASAYGRLLHWLGMIMATTVSMSKQLLDVL
jgi:hypothetical protein